MRTNCRYATLLASGKSIGSAYRLSRFSAAVAYFNRWALSSVTQSSQRCLVLIALWLCFFGCATAQFKSGAGDVGSFIVERAIACGASPISTNTISVTTSGWRYFEDDNGVVIRLAQDDYPALESLLIQTFGQPMKGPNDTPNGGRYGVYRFTSKGGVLQFGRDLVDGTHVEIIRPLNKRESTDAMAKALKDKEVQKALKGSP